MAKQLKPIGTEVRPASHREGRRNGQQIVTVTLPDEGDVKLIISRTGRNVQIFSGWRFIGEFQTKRSDFY